MQFRSIALLGSLVATMGCSTIAESRFNPFNWFGRSQSVEAAAPAEVVDPRPLVDEVTRLSVDPTPGGAILRATGLPPTQGYYDGALVSVSDGVPVDGVLEYNFRAFPPPEAARVSTAQSREIVVGLYLTRQELTGVRQIRINGAGNTRVASR